MEIENFNGLLTETYRLIIVEDSDVNFSNLTDLFEKTSIYLAPLNPGVHPRRFRVERFQTVDSALAKLRSPASKFDAILVNNRVSDNNRDDAIAALAHFGGSAPVILLTGLGDSDEDIRQCLQHGAVGYLSIPEMVYQGPERLSNAILDAIAIRQGEEQARQSMLTDLSQKAQSAASRISRPQRAVIIAFFGFVLFVGQPSVQRWEWSHRFDDEAVRGWFIAIAGVVWSIGMVDGKRSTPFLNSRRGSSPKS